MRSNSSTTAGACPLELVLYTDELNRRPSRPPDYEAESRALNALAQALADSPRTILQKLVQTALEICKAGSGGVSLLNKEDGEQTFYWPAIAGAWKQHIGGGTPRNFGPCGVVLDRDAVQLFTHPERYYPYLVPVSPPISEALLTPFYVEGKAVGTVWVIAHDEHRKFDAEDMRLVVNLGRFASSAYQVWAALDAQEKQAQALRESEARFRSLVTATTSIVWTVDEAGRFVTEQPSWAKYTGQTWEEYRDFGWANAIHPADRGRVRALWEAARSARTTYNADGRLWHAASGTYRHFEARGVPVYTADGSVREWVGMCADVEERKRIEEKLRRQSSRRDLLSQALQHLLSSQDPDRIVRELFPKVAAHLGVDTYFNYMVNPEGDALALHSYAGISEQTAREMQRLEFGQAICGTVAQTRQPIVAVDIQKSDYDKATLVRSFGIQAYACNPLMSGRRLLGTLSFASRTRTRFDDDELEFIRIVSRYVALAMERAQAEEKLRQSEQRLGGILRQATVGVAQVDLTGRFLLVNDRYCEIVGRPREELLRLRMQDITHPDDLPRNLLMFQQTAQTGEDFVIEKRYVRPNGSIVWVHNSVYAVRYASGRPEYIVAISLDITDRKQAEETKARLAGIVESSDDAIISKNLNSIITSWNQGAERLFGYTAQQAIGQPVTMIIPPDRVDEEPGILERIRRGERIEHYETVRRRKDSTLLDISLTVSPISDAQGNIVGASKIARDITDRKRAEEALQTLNAELEERVARRTAELVNTIAQREKLQEQLLQAQKMESVGTLASGIAHDFNNILNLILGYASLLQRDPGNPVKLLESVEVIKDTVKRGAALVQQLLAMGRKTAMKFEQVDINTAVKNLQTLVSETFPKTIAVSLLLDKEVPPVMADPSQITQVLLNLCVNARDAMPNGGELRLATGIISGAELRSRFHEATDPKYAWISVADTGLGMDETTKNRVFEPFFTTKEPGYGTGLGLSVVYGIISNHGGFVSVESQPGYRTTFQIYLPISEAAAESTHSQQQADDKEPGELFGAGETILFVDDEARQLRVMKNFLESEGYRVLEAADGAEAVETYLRHKNEIAASSST